MIRLEALRKGLNDKNAIAPPAKMFQLKMSAFKRVAVDWGMRNLRSSFVTKCMPASENKKERELVSFSIVTDSIVKRRYLSSAKV
jgi:hypothetical protein